MQGGEMAKVNRALAQSQVILDLAPETARPTLRVQYLDTAIGIVRMPKTFAVGAFGHEILWRK